MKKVSASTTLRIPLREEGATVPSFLASTKKADRAFDPSCLSQDMLAAARLQVARRRGNKVPASYKVSKEGVNKNLNKLDISLYLSLRQAFSHKSALATAKLVAKGLTNLSS